VGTTSACSAMTELITSRRGDLDRVLGADVQVVTTARADQVPINEPAQASASPRSQEYLLLSGRRLQPHRLSTTDIVSAVTELNARGVEFLPTPSPITPTTARIGDISQDVADLRRSGSS